MWLSAGAGENPIRDSANKVSQPTGTNGPAAIRGMGGLIGTPAAAMSVHRHPADCDATGCDEAILAAILDHLSLPIMLVGEDFTVHFANAAARGGADNEAPLAALEQAFLESDRKDATRLRSAIADTCARGPRHAVSVSGGNSMPAVVVTIPFSGTGPNDRRALVLVRNGIKVSGTLLGSLRELFNLSPAEAEVAIALGTGATIDHVAHDRGVKRNTLRCQLASIMERTGTHRQGELVALITQIDTFVLAILVSGFVLSLPAFSSLQDFQIT
jgi:DNA-binding CsgD family transcriptional regulator